jgi:tripartite-type tricarboxylate transporter receptor subunit TctC
MDSRLRMGLHRPMRTLARILVSAALLLGLAPASRAADEISFKGETITILIGYGIGGSYDVYGRLAGRFLGKYLPGNPLVVPQNMTGAGSLAAANYLYNIAPKDGTYLGVIGQTIPVDQLFDNSGKRFESAKFTWIGRMAAGDETILVWHGAPVRSIADAKRISVVIAAAGPASGSAVYPTLLNHLIGTRFRVVRGYTGTNEMLNAIEKGEADGVGSVNVATLTSQFRPWLRDKKVRVLAQVSMTRHPAFPDVPTFPELGRTEEQKEVLRLFAEGGDVGRALIAPPGLAPARVAVLRAGFVRMMKDPQLLAFAKQAGLDISPLDGAALQKIIADIAATPKTVVAHAKAAAEFPH